MSCEYDPFPFRNGLLITYLGGLVQATIVDLRYHMKKVLAALRRNEEVSVLYHNKKIASIIPAPQQPKIPLEEHIFFGMLIDKTVSVQKQMDRLRSERYRDIR